MGNFYSKCCATPGFYANESASQRDTIDFQTKRPMNRERMFDEDLKFISGSGQGNLTDRGTLKKDPLSDLAAKDTMSCH